MAIALSPSLLLLSHKMLFSQPQGSGAFTDLKTYQMNNSKEAHLDSDQPDRMVAFSLHISIMLEGITHYKIKNNMFYQYSCCQQ